MGQDVQSVISFCVQYCTLQLTTTKIHGQSQNIVKEAVTLQLQLHSIGGS